jgi:NADH-quinone oxidoreductase subunit L
MEKILILLIAIPFFGFLLSIVIPEKNERTLSWVAYISVGFHALVATTFVVYWILNGHPYLSYKEWTLYKTDHYEFFIDLMFDKIVVVYLLTGAFLTFLITVYSRYYLHREPGYKRFFNTILFFYLGYTITILSGNFETLFVGWEILGIASFLLIAFYRTRYLPVKNAVKVFSIYRVGDVGLLLAMWMCHHLWGENITFSQLHNFDVINAGNHSHTLEGMLIALFILIAAAAKSAQLPFSSWLPRAMEGPTPSSAIFYGSLSVHLGVFLLLRTYPFWEGQYLIRILIFLLGLLTTILATGISRVQSSVKSQIAYSSIAQIGLIFIEVSFGFHILALVHFAGNAFLRTYQLLVSPSIVSYLIKEQFYHFEPRKKSIEGKWFPRKLENTLYILCVKEWNLDSFMYRYFWNPLKAIGKRLDFLTIRSLVFIFLPIFLFGVYSLYFHNGSDNQVLHTYLPYIFAIIGLMMVLKAFSERKHALLSWVLVVSNHFWTALAISFNERFNITEVIVYLSGIFGAGIFGLYLLRRMKREKNGIDLNRFHGHSFQHPVIGMLFLISCLSLSGFPISPTFVGEDLVFSHIHEDQWFLAACVALSFVLDGLAIMRIYARVFLGPHVLHDEAIAYRSS